MLLGTTMTLRVMRMKKRKKLRKIMETQVPMVTKRTMN